MIRFLSAASFLASPIAANAEAIINQNHPGHVYPAVVCELSYKGTTWNCDAIGISIGNYSLNYHFFGAKGTIVSYIVDKNTISDDQQRVTGIWVRRNINDRGKVIEIDGICEAIKDESRGLFQVGCNSYDGIPASGIFRF